MKKPIVQIRPIEEKIFIIRGLKVMLDSHLSELYGVKTKVLLQAVKRNHDRFPEDFMFQLSTVEHRNLRSQIVTSSSGYGGRRYEPYVFTENGVAMLSSVLNSQRAIRANIQIMRVFTKMRDTIAQHRGLQEKIKKLEGKFDRKFVVVFRAIQLLLDGPQKPVTVRGFRNNRDRNSLDQAESSRRQGLCRVHPSI